MGRWAPDAAGRLAQAALDLYGERGYERTTVAEIAERAGLTERTFFRHFDDKREVLFFGAGALKDFLVSAVAVAPASSGPVAAILAALEAAASTIFEERREFSRRRQAVISANPELLERELIKLATLASALAEAVRGRGVAEPAASLAGEAGIAVFKIAFQHWTADEEDRTLSELIRSTGEELQLVAAATAPPSRRSG